MSKKIVKVGDIECGGKELFLISGPCVIEEESIMMKTAEKLREVQEMVTYFRQWTMDTQVSLRSGQFGARKSRSQKTTATAGISSKCFLSQLRFQIPCGTYRS